VRRETLDLRFGHSEEYPGATSPDGGSGGDHLPKGAQSPLLRQNPEAGFLQDWRELWREQSLSGSTMPFCVGLQNRNARFDSWVPRPSLAPGNRGFWLCGGDRGVMSARVAFRIAPTAMRRTPRLHSHVVVTSAIRDDGRIVAVAATMSHAGALPGRRPAALGAALRQRPTEVPADEVQFP
jgi:hypothetical protein